MTRSESPRGLDTVPDTSHACVLYAIFNSAAGAIKIGRSADRPGARRRFNVLQTSNAHKLHLARIWDGTENEERRLHEQLAPWRIRGEWFAAVKPVQVAIGVRLRTEPTAAFTLAEVDWLLDRQRVAGWNEVVGAILDIGARKAAG